MRSSLKYVAVVWDPHTADNAKQIEHVQRRFLRYTSTSFILKIPYTPHIYTPIAIHLGLASLAARHRIASIKFLKGLLNNTVDSPVLLSLICFKIPPRSSRSNVFFYVPYATINYKANEL